MSANIYKRSKTGNTSQNIKYSSLPVSCDFIIKRLGFLGIKAKFHDFVKVQFAKRGSVVVSTISKPTSVYAQTLHHFIHV